MLQSWQQQIFSNTLFEKILCQITPSVPSLTMHDKP